MSSRSQEQDGVSDQDKTMELSRLIERLQQTDDAEAAVAAAKGALQIEPQIRQWRFHSSREHVRGSLLLSLGDSNQRRTLGDHAENVEEAINAYEAALTVFTREAFPQEWATTQRHLANAYVSRIMGSKAENLESAIRAYEAALTVLTREALPQEWATTQRHLGDAYVNRIMGSKAENLESAIRAYEAALTVFTQEAFPQEWATTQRHLADAYVSRITGSKAENLESAIRAYEAALTVFTREASPREWAQTQSDLSAAYRRRGEIATPRTRAGPYDIRQYVNVLYATNRVIDYSGPSPIPLTSITYRRSPALSLGSALVRVPDAHKIGGVERPIDITIFGFTIFRASENEKKYFTLKEINRLDREGAIRLLQANSEHSAMVFVHGFNTSFEDAIFKTAQIAYDSHFCGVPIAFSWPSEGSIVGYNYDRESASFSWDSLLELFHFIKKDAELSKVYVIAHSMGNQVLLDALAHAHDEGGELPLSEVIMASPDVDRDVFIKRVAELKLLAGGLTLYASSADKAMVASRINAGGVRAGDIPAGGPVIAPGLDTIDITALGDDPFALNHGVFSSSRSVIDDIGRLISSTGLGRRLKPGERSPQLLPIPAIPPPTYWKYPN